MKSRLLSALAMLLAFTSAFAMKVPLTISLDAYSGLSMTYDEATKVYSFKVEKNPSVNYATFHFQVLEEDFPEGIKYLSFEYKTSRYMSFLMFRMYDSPTAKSAKVVTEFRPELHPADEWRTCQLDVSNLVNARRNKLGTAGTWQDIRWYEPSVGTEFQIRNIRYDDGEIGYKDIDVDGQSTVVIEAEDFNTGTGYKAMNQPRQKRGPYVNPTGNRFPIYAWGGPDFNNVRGPLGLKKEFQDLWECGFTMTLGSAWPGVDMAALFTGQEINGVQVDLFEGTELKILAKADIRDRDHVEEIKPSPNLAGYHIRDEPVVKDLPEMGYWFETLRQWDPSDRIFYGNMHPMSSSGSDEGLGAADYSDYVDRFVQANNPSFLSYDQYPIRHHKTNDVIFLRDRWFPNLELMAAKARQYKVPMWTFVQSCQSSAAVNPDEQPKPRFEWMSLCAFCGLAYGSQCLQYYIYAYEYSPEYNYQNACTGPDGERTDTWYYAQEINRQVHAQSFVFLGSELEMSAHTNAVTPDLCRRLTPEMLPVGVANVVTDGQGMLVTTLRNGKSRYLMIVNPDVNNSQSVEITTTKAMHQVQHDGTITDLAAGKHEYDLAIGDYIIYQVENDLPDHIAYYLKEDAHLSAPLAPGEFDNYRNEVTGPDVRAIENASNGHYLAYMGTSDWNEYGVSYFKDQAGTVSFTDALRNWGSWYNYELNATTDTDVDIAISYSVPWNEYGQIASVGVEPGKYFIENNPSLNWPKQYAASMILELDGVELTPANQPLRPAVPEVFTEDGSEFNRILADKSQWVSTKEADGTTSNVLYFWPKAGGNNSFEPTVNSTPDYTNVHLTRGIHTLRVKSLCYPWHFDAIKLTKPGTTSGIDNIDADAENATVEWYNLQGMRINPETATPGLYLRRQGNKTEKIAL
ncbi:MAG: hypothetical protein NC343_03225 [Muribaculum sp.]|nr:hypothetical protein [Muribaculaceae bacterium]MCM1080739.1 hypothetical protein [Muribaculum sp.]